LRDRYSIILFLLFSISGAVYGQKDSVAQKADTTHGRVFLLQEVKRNGEVLPEVEIKEVTVIGHKGTSRKTLYRRYDRLTYNLKKVYPYAVIVRQKLYQVNEELTAMTDEKERRKYLRGVEEFVLGEYEDDMEDMTITQGRLLIKLIDRETQNTSYDLIKLYRGSLSAVFWQGIARIFGTNLKAEYDPYGEDAMIEAIVQDIESGIILIP
jgi:hypothetical protein